MRTLAPPLQLIAVVIHRGPFYLFILKRKHKQANKKMNGGRNDVACFCCYRSLESSEVKCLRMNMKVYSLGASRRCDAATEIVCRDVSALFLSTCGHFYAFIREIAVERRQEMRRERVRGEGRQRSTARFEQGCCGSWSAP